MLEAFPDPSEPEQIDFESGPTPELEVGDIEAELRLVDNAPDEDQAELDVEGDRPDVDEYGFDLVDDAGVEDTEDTPEVGDKLRPRITRLPAKASRSTEADGELVHWRRRLLNNMAKVPLLTREQEVELAKRIESGDQTAQEHLTEANLLLVTSVVRKGNYKGRGLEEGELIDEGVIGLMKAVKKFDWRLGYKFSTYATWWIKQAISRAIVDKGRSVRLPAHIHERSSAVQSARDFLTDLNGQPPTDEEIAKWLGRTEKEVEDLSRASQPITSLDQTIANQEREKTTFLDLLEDPASGNDIRDEDLIKRINASAIQKALKTLTQQEREVIIARYGIGGNDPMTLLEVGATYHIGRDRVRNIENAALHKLGAIKGLSARLGIESSDDTSE